MINQLWWIIHKDLISECRERRVWPAMLLAGAVVVFVFALPMDLLPQQKQTLAGGLLWLAVFFAGMAAIDRSFAAEREHGCWESLKLYPLPAAVVYVAKLIANVIALAVLQCLLIPLFFLLSDLPLLPVLPRLLIVAALGNLGIAAVGTLVSALAAALGRSAHLLILLTLPLVLPVLLAAAEATRWLCQGEAGAMWWRWVHFLVVFTIVFLAAGMLLFEYATED